MPIPVVPPPRAIAIAAQDFEPLSFAGFRAHMPMTEARALVSSAGGSLTCKATSDPRLRECTGSTRLPTVSRPFRLLISSVRDTAAVIVLTGAVPESDSRRWVGSLTRGFGTPNHRKDRRVSESWQWIRRSQMLRVIRNEADGIHETAVTLTDGPLLDALGPPPPVQQRPGPKKQKPD